MRFSLPRATLVPLIIACALFMENLDGAIIATALPAISKSLHADPLHLNLAITSYMFSLAVFIPLSGWMADRYGAQTVFRAAILIFTLSSAACGFAQDLPQLILARLAQGLGGAMMVPVGRLVLLRTVPKAELVGAMAWLTAPAMIGPVLGPPVGGLIVTYLSWRWIFFVNLPIGLLGIYLATKFIENTKEVRSDPLDVKGFLLMALALCGLVFSFETVGRDLLPGGVVVALFAGGSLCLGLYVWHAHRVKAPVVDLDLFRVPTFFAAAVGGSLFRVGVGALPFLLPLMLQFGFGLSPFASGMLTFASAIGAMLMKLTAGPILRRFGFRPVLVGNAMLGVFFLAGCAAFRPDTPHMVIFTFLLVGGFFRSLQFTSLNTLTFAEIPAELMSRATTLSSMLQQLSLSLGIGVGAMMLNFTLAFKAQPELETNDFWPAIVGVAVISGISTWFFVRLDKNAGAEISGHHEVVTPPPLKQEQG